MHTEEHRWFSRDLQRDMILKVYGHWGKSLLVFPCSRGRYFDYETMGMVAAISGFIGAGKVKLFCVDSVDSESWYHFGIPPAERNARHEAYDRYLVGEVLPFIRDHCRLPQERPIATGCSMGAFHSVNCFLKHPDAFAGTIALSGLYRLDRPEFGMGPADIPAVYFNSPVHYFSGLSDPGILEACRRGRIILCAGQGAWEAEAVEDTRRMQDRFREKAVPAWVDFWGPDVHHDWPWWYRQMNYFLHHLFG